MDIDRVFGVDGIFAGENAIRVSVCEARGREIGDNGNFSEDIAGAGDAGAELAGCSIDRDLQRSDCISLDSAFAGHRDLNNRPSARKLD